MHFKPTLFDLGFSGCDLGILYPNNLTLKVFTHNYLHPGICLSLASDPVPWIPGYHSQWGYYLSDQWPHILSSGGWATTEICLSSHIDQQVTRSTFTSGWPDKCYLHQGLPLTLGVYLWADVLACVTTVLVLTGECVGHLPHGTWHAHAYLRAVDTTPRHNRGIHEGCCPIWVPRKSDRVISM